MADGQAGVGLRRLAARACAWIVVVGLVVASLGRPTGARPRRPQEAAAAAEDGPIVRAIRVEGNRRYTTRQLVSALGQAVGEPLDPEVIRRGIKVLFDVFRVRAEVSQRPVAGDGGEDGPGAVELLLRVTELSRDLEPRFIGNQRIDDDELRAWAGLGSEGEVFLYQAKRVREKLLEHYRKEGFYFAEVRVVERPGGVDEETGEYTAPDLIFEIIEGPKVRVRDVVLHGNENLKGAGGLIFGRGLKGLAGVELHGPRLFGWFASAFDRETLDADIIGLREVYRDYGYLDAVVELERLEFSEDRSRVTIHIAIDEGERYRVGSLHIQAIQFADEHGSRWSEVPLAIPEEELLPELQVQAGEVYRRNEVRADTRTLRSLFGKKGYIDHRSLPVLDRWQFLDPELVFDPKEPVVHVTYRLHQGRQQFIREILVSGNLHTRDRVVRRLITVDPGDVADPEEISRSRNRLQGSGMFSNTRNPLNHREPTYRFIETDDPNWKDLEFQVQEGEVLTFQLSGGLSSNTGAFGLFSITHNNFDIQRPPSSPLDLIDGVLDRTVFHGGGQELNLQASPGTEVSFYRIFFSDPDIFRRHRDRIGLTLTAQQRQRRYRTHDEDRRELGFRLGRQVGPDSSVYLGYTFGNIDVNDITLGGEPRLANPLAVPRTLKEQEGTNDLSFLEIGYRMRNTDNRISPRNGQSFVLSAKVYDEALQSDFEFVKAELSWDWFDELGVEGVGLNDRIHFGLRGGVAQPYGISEDVPYSERYFLGGQRSMRGFDFRGVGPNRRGIPLGGESFLFTTLEWRHPLVSTTQPGTYREIETFHFGLFVDAGVLDPEPFQLDLSEARVSYGFLFGLGVPLPITFSFGWPLVQGDGDQTQVLGFNVGF